MSMLAFVGNCYVPVIVGGWFHFEFLFSLISFGSPLFSVLQVFLSINNNGFTIKETTPFLFCIFRAIKRAEDAVDSRKTPVSVA